MPYFIELTNYYDVDDKRIFVNLDHVEYYLRDAGWTLVKLVDGTALQVTEMPEDIHGMMKSEMSEY